MAGEFAETTIGRLLSFANGRSSPERADGLPYPVYGSNGVIGHAAEANADAGAIVIGRVGSYCGSLYLAKKRCWITDNAIRATALDDNAPRYLFYLLGTLSLNSWRAGSGQPLLNQDILSRIPALVPEPFEQRAIAHILGALDDKIDLNRRMNETLEAMARALFRDWFVDFGPTRAKMEGRAPGLPPRLAALFPDRLDEQGKPEGWRARPVGDFAELKGGKQLVKERITPDGRTPVFGGAGVMGFTDEHNADGFVISVGRVGAYCGQFFSHRGKAWINNNASLIRPYTGISGEWLFQALRYANIEVIKKGAAQPFVSNTDIAGMPIIWPGGSVVSQFAEILVPLMLKAEQNQAESVALTALRDTLLPKLISGEVRVKDADTFLDRVL